VSLFARRRRPMPEANRVQALFPTGSRVVPNPVGTAPGIDLEVPRQGRRPCRVFALPGVPAEMFHIWSDSVADAIRGMLDSPRVLYHRRIKCFGAGESDLEKMLPDLIRRGREPRVGITVSAATITLRITAEGESDEAARAATDSTVATIRECLGTLVFGEDDDELEDSVVRLLTAKDATLSTVEWGTDGLLAHWLGEASAASERYVGGIVAASAAARECVMDACAVEGPIEMMIGEMAKGCKRFLNSDYVLATGPLPIYDPAGSSVPDFWYALATPNGLSVRSSPYAGNPDILKILSAKRALNWLRLELL